MGTTRRFASALAAALLASMVLASEPAAEPASNVFMTCDGVSVGGEPTVVLISGYHDSSDVWTRDDVLSLHAPAVGPPVFTALARSHRVCAYDRPGTIRYIDDGPLTERTPVVPQPRWWGTHWVG